MANPQRGRPPLSGSVRRQIRLRSSVFLLWDAKKTSLDFGGATNSESSEFLIRLPTEVLNLTKPSLTCRIHRTLLAF